MSKIEDIGWRSLHLQRYEPLRLATGTSDSPVNVLIEVEAGGMKGYGVAAPNSVTGETERSIVGFLERIASQLKGEPADPTRVREIVGDRRPAATCGIDMCLYDLMGKEKHLPTFRAMGAVREAIETSITVGIMEPEYTLERAKNRAAEGFRILKVKGGLDVHEDIKKLSMIRDELGEAITLRFDCNQGYSEQEALSFLEEVEPLDIQFVEQPVDANDLESLFRVARQSPVPIMADESVRTPADAKRVVEGGVPMINIKLAKCGGIGPAVQISQVCEEGGVAAMIGCMAECEASISAGLHFALSQASVNYADLDSFLSLTNDPTQALECNGGVLSPSERPGLGIILGE